MVCLTFSEWLIHAIDWFIYWFIYFLSYKRRSWKHFFSVFPLHACRLRLSLLEKYTSDENETDAMYYETSHRITDLWLLVEIISLAEDMRDTFEINYLGLKWSGNLTWRHLTSYYCLKAAFQPWHANQSILLIVSKEEIFLLLLLNFYLAPKLNLVLAEFLKNKHGWMKTWLGIATRERLCQSHAGPQLHFKLNKNNNTTTLSRVANISCSGNRRKSSSFFSQGCRVLFLLCFVLYFWFAKEVIR